MSKGSILLLRVVSCDENENFTRVEKEVFVVYLIFPELSNYFVFKYVLNANKTPVLKKKPNDYIRS